MHTNWCVLIEISMEIGMWNFWSVINGHCTDGKISLYSIATPTLVFATTSRTNPWNLNCWELAILKNSGFFWVGHFDFFFKKKNASSPWKLVANYVLEWMGLNFDDYTGLQPKITPPNISARSVRWGKDLVGWGHLINIWLVYLTGHTIKGQHRYPNIGWNTF